MKTSRRETLGLALLLLLGLAALGSAVFFGLHLLERREPPETSESKTATDYYNELHTVYIGGVPYTEKELDTYLLIGVDIEGKQKSSGLHVNSAQADVLLLLARDPETRKVTLLQLNRDTMAIIDTFGLGGVRAGQIRAQLALAHTYGDGLQQSCENTVDAVSRFLFGIHIDHYLCVTLSAVESLTDALGGVEVTIPADLTELDPRLTAGATVRMDGALARSYIQARGGLSNSTNLFRMERQRNFLSAILPEITRQKGTGRYSVLYDSVAPYLVTDCSAPQLLSAAESFADALPAEILTLPGEAVKGAEYMEFYPDAEETRRIATECFFARREE